MIPCACCRLYRGCMICHFRLLGFMHPELLIDKRSLNRTSHFCKSYKVLGHRITAEGRFGSAEQHPCVGVCERQSDLHTAEGLFTSLGYSSP